MHLLRSIPGSLWCALLLPALCGMRGHSQAAPASIIAHAVATAIGPAAIRLELSADSPAGALVAGYNIYRDGVWIAAITNRNYAPTNLKTVAQ